ncbi:CbtB-domain containing protein [Stappia sp. F7233]|uniref:CbtB-domain containing protein n=1 Tax=Stappia albiluteola TaxID=2758565 RepID=A0A839ABR9_9HYPH|nr:CbtB-domain containing protein [Stappia albiluteola]MBA5776444.1 CbtB-domain containing protein [Stappia albiluteola]
MPSAVSSQSLTSRAALLPTLIFTALFGAFLVYGAGFAHSNVLHNAAHDSRHALGFPCH